MFFRSKNGKDSAEPAPVAVPVAAPLATSEPAAPAKPAPAPDQPVSASAAADSAAAPVAASSLPPDELRKRAEASQRLSLAVGELILLMARLPGHSERKLSELMGLIIPAARTGQYGVLQAQSKTRGTVAPVAAVLWARVSSEVDQRLSETLDQPMRLAPKDWRSGETLWLIEAVGEDRAIAALMQRLRGKEWSGQPVKARVKDASGVVKVRLLTPPPAPNGAAPPAPSSHN